METNWQWWVQWAGLKPLLLTLVATPLWTMLALIVFKHKIDWLQFPLISFYFVYSTFIIFSFIPICGDRFHSKKKETKAICRMQSSVVLDGCQTAQCYNVFVFEYLSTLTWPLCIFFMLPFALHWPPRVYYALFDWQTTCAATWRKGCDILVHKSQPLRMACLSEAWNQRSPKPRSGSSKIPPQILWGPVSTTQWLLHSTNPQDCWLSRHHTCHHAATFYISESWLK